MARGFWKGLLHGAGISAIGLAALSLLTPLPEQGETPSRQGESSAVGASEPVESAPSAVAAPEEKAKMPESSESDTESGEGAISGGVTDAEGDAVASETLDESGSAADTSDAGAEPAPSDKDARPQASAIDLPVGSEFGRGGDGLPALPTPLTANSQSGQMEPPAVSAPAAEPAPVGTTAANLPPQAEMLGSDLSKTEAPEAEEDPAVQTPSTQTAPAPIELPGKVPASDQDSLPATSSGGAIPAQTTAESATATGDADVTGPAEQGGEDADSAATLSDPSAAQGDQGSEAPALPSPSLDLSTPPDLSDLRSLKRD